MDHRFLSGLSQGEGGLSGLPGREGTEVSIQDPPGRPRIPRVFTDAFLTQQSHKNV